MICLVLSRFSLIISNQSQAGDLSQKIQLNISEVDLLTHFGACEVKFLVDLFKNY